jgi:hypothetical protein
MKKQFLFFLKMACVLLFTVSCKKGPGIGGEASIKGKVTGMLYDKNFAVKLNSGNVGNWIVNIIYGDDVAIDANQRTSYDGSFEFQYLREGHYTVFTYSRSHKTNSVDSAIILGVDITGKKQVLDLPDIQIFH